MISRLLPHQWPELEAIFAANGHPLPPYSQLPAVVERDESGQIVGVLLAHQFSIELELWVAPAYRGNGVATRLAEALEPEMREMAPFAAYARNEATVALCEQFGMTEQHGTLYVMEA